MLAILTVVLTRVESRPRSTWIRHLSASAITYLLAELHFSRQLHSPGVYDQKDVFAMLGQVHQ